MCLNLPGEPVIVKDPFHLWSLDALLKVYPDACIVHIHRDPAATLGSWANYVTGVLSICSAQIDPVTVGQLWLEQFRVGMKNLLQVRSKAPKGAILDVRYGDVSKAPLETARRILHHFGFNPGEATRGRISRYLEQHSPQQHKSHPYSLERFGFNADQLRAEFREYGAQLGESP
jgi:hypothetical protein